MSLFAIADIHFGKGVNKSMDIFGGPWVGHMDKIIKNWRDTVTDGDTVLIPGDICWAKKLPEAKTDMEILQSLPGKRCFWKAITTIGGIPRTKLRRRIRICFF